MQINFPEAVRLRAPRGLTEAMKLAAKERHTTPAEWARQALLRSLERDGVRLRDGQAEVLDGALPDRK